MKTQIYKFQRPIIGDTALVYNKDRSEQGQIRMTNDLEFLFGERFKIYVVGRLRKDGNIEIDRVVQDQDW